MSAATQRPNHAHDVPAQEDDKRLDRLLEYTKFHIGSYLSIGGGLVALIGSASKAQEQAFLSRLVGSPGALALALVLMAIAGLSGGVIASCCTQNHTFESVWHKRQGPYKAEWIKGQTWACIEHISFWLSWRTLRWSF
jgi:hypothetical protein